jgi:hypothetical protein
MKPETALRTGPCPGTLRIIPVHFAHGLARKANNPRGPWNRPLAWQWAGRREGPPARVVYLPVDFGDRMRRPEGD